MFLIAVYSLSANEVGEQIMKIYGVLLKIEMFMGGLCYTVLGGFHEKEGIGDERGKLQP